METINWEQLFARLRPILVNGSAQVACDRKDEILTLLRSYESNEIDFEPFCRYNPGWYTKNLVEEFGDNCNVIIMCWSTLQMSMFHGHEKSNCFVKLLSGTLIEQQVPYPVDGRQEYVAMRERVMKRNDVSYIDDSIGLHKMINRSNTNNCVSLHIYMPAYKYSRVFVESDYNDAIFTDTSRLVKINFDNVDGSD